MKWISNFLFVQFPRHSRTPLVESMNAKLINDEKQWTMEIMKILLLIKNATCKEQDDNCWSMSFNYFFFISGVGSIKEEKSFFRLQNLPLKRLRTVYDKRIYWFPICLNFFFPRHISCAKNVHRTHTQTRHTYYSHNISSTHRQTEMDIKKLFHIHCWHNHTRIFN